MSLHGLFSCLLYTSFHAKLFPHAFQPPHLVDDGFHDDHGHDGEQFAIFFNRIYLEDDEPLADQVDVLRGVEQEIVTPAPVKMCIRDRSSGATSTSSKTDSVGFER